MKFFDTALTQKPSSESLIANTNSRQNHYSNENVNSFAQLAQK